MPRAPFSRERYRTPRTRRREIVVPIPRRFKASRVGAPDGRGGAKIALEMADEFTPEERAALAPDRKSTRLNSSHGYISYAVFCLKKKKKHNKKTHRDRRD